MPDNHQIICKSQNGRLIWYDPVHSHAATHFEDTLDLKKLTTEVISQLELNGEKIDIDVDMGRTIGTSDVVETDSTDELVYAFRKDRQDQGLVPFTKSRKAKNSSTISLHFLNCADGTYELTSVWIGADDSPPFPLDLLATADSKDYWNKHAFVWGSQEIIKGSAIFTRPW